MPRLHNWSHKRTESRSNQALCPTAKNLKSTSHHCHSWKTPVTICQKWFIILYTLLYTYSMYIHIQLYMYVYNICIYPIISSAPIKKSGFKHGSIVFRSCRTTLKPLQLHKNCWCIYIYIHTIHTYSCWAHDLLFPASLTRPIPCTCGSTQKVCTWLQLECLHPNLYLGCSHQHHKALHIFIIQLCIYIYIYIHIAKKRHKSSLIPKWFLWKTLNWTNWLDGSQASILDG